MSENSLFCGNCGHGLSSDSSFCHECGKPSNTTKISFSDYIRKYIHAGFLKVKTRKKAYLGILIVPLILGIFVYQSFLINEARDEAAQANQAALDARSDIEKNRTETLSDLGAQKKEMQSLLAKDTSGINVTSVVQKWTPIIGYIYCEYTDQYGDSQAQSGSGTLLINNDGSRSVLTNYHVVSDDNGRIVQGCSIKFPADSKTYIAYTSDITTTNDAADVAYVRINSPDNTLRNIASDGRSYCDNVPNVGDRIVVLGYPGIGSQTSITATEGIISGYDGNYYVTSAKVAHGNSGGAAIDLANNCFLGIPTYVKTDTAESLARILKWQSF